MIINFLLDKITVIKNKNIVGNVEARNNLKITKVTEQNVTNVVKDQAALNIHFDFKVDYGDKIANILLAGKIIYLVDVKTKKDILETWKKEERIDPKFSQPILNNILTRCNIKALSLESEVNLPPHVPFPRVALKTDVDTQAKAAS